MPTTPTNEDATSPRDFQIVAAASDLQWIDAAAPESTETKLRRFSMTAYTGGPMQLAGWRYPVVVDLAGLQATAKPKVFLEHDRTARVGHIDSVQINQSTLGVTGVVSASGKAAQEVLADAANGFPWQASISARALDVQWVPEGTNAQANGQTFNGPVNIARQSMLGEVSFVALGADDSTSAQIAAHKESPMPPAPGIIPTPETSGITAAPVTTTIASETPSQTPETIRAAAATEMKRIAAIQKVCGTSGKHAQIAAQAVEEGWSQDKTELAVLRADRPTAPAAHMHDNRIDQKVILATAGFAGRLPEKTLLAYYGEPAVEAAGKLRGIGVQEFFRLCARAEGRELPPCVGKGTEFIQAAFSTLSLPGILSILTNSRQLIASIATTGSKSTLVPQDNPMVGKFQVVSSAYLGNGTIAGNSNKAWYLMADPNVMAAIEVAFLNGVEQPTVEQAVEDFETLGIKFRGYIDFGVAMQDPRAALKLKGEA